MNLPKISVIVVCRNVGSKIGDTIRLIRNQNYSNVELIIIDGASTDSTVETINEHLSEIDIFVSEKDNGIYDAMNKGLKLATGEWISFINVGDSFADNNVLIDVFGKMISDSIQLIGGNTINFFADGHTEIHYAESATAIRTRIPFSHQACFTRRILRNTSKPFQFDLRYKIAADYNLFYYIYHNYGADAIRITDRSIARYQQEGSTSLNNYRKAKAEYLRIQSAHPSIMWIKELLKYFILG